MGERIIEGVEAEISAAVEAAHKAFQTWRRTSPAERAAYLHKIADIAEARVEQLAVVETRDNGSLLRSHRRGVMPRVAMKMECTVLAWPATRASR